MVNKQQIFYSALEFFAPSTCLLCKNRHAIDGFCESCREDLPVIRNSCCCCGVSLATEGLCAKCIHKPPAYDRVISVYSYRRPVNQLIRSLKYNQRLEVVSALGEGLIKLIQARQEKPPDCLIPVPLHSRRLISRGFNQSLELAKLLSKQFSIEINTDIVKRIKATTPQFELPHKARHANVHKAFKLSSKPFYESVTLVDDIITSGATVNELASLFKKAGVKHVSVWALARTT